MGPVKMAETTPKDSELSKAQSPKPADLPPCLGSTGPRDEVYIDLSRSWRDRIRRVCPTDRCGHVAPQIASEISHPVDSSRDHGLIGLLLPPLPLSGRELSEGRLSVHIIWPRVRAIVHRGVLLSEDRLHPNGKNHGQNCNDGFHDSTSV